RGTSRRRKIRLQFARCSATVPSAAPSNWILQGQGMEANGITEGWFTFETTVGRGKGHVRLMGNKAWTLLTTLQELKGFEEKKGENRVKGIEHGASPGRNTCIHPHIEHADQLASQ